MKFHRGGLGFAAGMIQCYFHLQHYVGVSSYVVYPLLSDLERGAVGVFVRGVQHGIVGFFPQRNFPAVQFLFGGNIGLDGYGLVEGEGLPGGRRKDADFGVVLVFLFFTGKERQAGCQGEEYEKKRFFHGCCRF